MNKLEKLDVNSQSFEAGGKTYYVQLDQLSAARYEPYLLLSMKMLTGATFNEVFNRFKDINIAVSKGNDIMAGLRKAYELSLEGMVGLKQFADKKNPADVLMFATLFCNTEDEKIWEWDVNAALKKVEDFKNSRISIDSFFLLARLATTEFNNCLDYINQLSPERMNPKSKIK